MMYIGYILLGILQIQFLIIGFVFSANSSKIMNTIFYINYFGISTYAFIFFGSKNTLMCIILFLTTEFYTLLLILKNKQENK